MKTDSQTDWLARNRLVLGVLVVATEVTLLTSHVSAFVYPLLLPVQWVLAVRSSDLVRAGWSVLAGASAFWATQWYVTFLSKGHVGFRPIPYVVGAGTTLLIWVTSGRRRAHRQHTSGN